MYDCSICTGKFLIKNGVVTCAEHFICNDCVIHTFTSASENPVSEIFPVKCCMKAPGCHRGPTILRRGLVAHLLSPEVNVTYDRKEVEYYTPPALKLYCIECRAWLPPSTFQAAPQGGVVRRRGQCWLCRQRDDFSLGQQFICAPFLVASRRYLILIAIYYIMFELDDSDPYITYYSVRFLELIKHKQYQGDWAQGRYGSQERQKHAPI